MSYSKAVIRKINQYDVKGNLAHTSKFFLALCSINHLTTKEHMERVALLAEKVAKKLRKDVKATFFAGLLHDVGKITLPADLFDGYNIDSEKYEQVKAHAINSFNALKDFHLFSALVAGLHHNTYSSGYGITVKDFPKNFSVKTIKKVLDIAVIVSVCDFVDAFKNRKTEIKDGTQGPTLKDMLYNKYPDDTEVVDVVLSIG